MSNTEKKRILILYTGLELGGAETSLLGLLYGFDYDRVDVDLFLNLHKGELLPLVPPEVNLLPEVPGYRALELPIKQSFLTGRLMIPLTRIYARAVTSIRRKKHYFRDYCYVYKQNVQSRAVRFLPAFKGHYDMAISFIDPHFVLAKKVDAAVKLGWFHTDHSKVDVDEPLDSRMWAGVDYIVNVSEGCKAAFDAKHPATQDKSIVIENLLSQEVVRSRAQLIPQTDIEREMPRDGALRILSVGRFVDAKNFDHVPAICRLMRDRGLNVRWYLIGFGGDEALIREKIAGEGMEQYVIILGKKDNPYPYIEACDLYCQPSRYEGKSVTVREAQMLSKPVVIARYATSAAQLTDGYDGVIVPQDDEGCAEGIARVLRDPALMRTLSGNCAASDYSNRREVDKLYALMDMPAAD
ncbi:MAG: glycosyltransferase [Clostridia bacterium]|nr:glycosyltransferase [Clostridia bacterium]